MALSYKNDEDVDERLDPASDTARQLYSQENDELPGYDRAGDGLDDHPVSAGDASGRSGDLSGGATKNIDTAKNQEEQGGWANNFSGTSESKGSGRIKSLKKKGPLGLIIGLLLGGGGLFSFMIAPGIGIVQMKEIVSGDLNDQVGAMSLRSDKVLMARLKGMKAPGICAGKVQIRCKFTTMSKRQLDKFKKAGFAIETEKTRPFGRERITKMTTPDGKEIKNPADLMSEARKNPATRGAIRKAFNPKFAGLSDSVANKVFARFHTDKSKKVTGETKEERDKAVNGATAGEKAGVNAQGFLTDESGRNYVVDENGNKVYESGEGSNPDKFKEISDKNQANLSSIHEKASSASIGKKATSGVLSSGLKGVSLIGAADTACTVYNTARAVAAAAKVTRALQLAQYAMVFFNTADAIKAGDATPGQVEYLGNILTATDTRQMIEDETSVTGGSTDADGNATITSKEKPNPFYGKNAFDSPGYAVAAYNDAPTLTTRSQQYMVGGGLTGTLSGVMDSIASKLGGRSNIRSTCKVVQSWWARTVGLIAGIVSAVGSFGVSTALSVGASIAIGFAMPFLEAALADIIAGTVVSSNTNGVDSGDAIFAGSGALLGGMAQARGMKPANKSDLESYMAVTNEVKSEDAAMETYMARTTPFDINNQYSFLGSFVRKINPTVLKSTASISGALLNVPTILATATSSIVPHVGATETFNEARFSKCNDPGYEELKIDADVFCNVRYTMSNEELNMDPVETLDWMVSHNQIDGDTGEAKSGSNYEHWVEKCVDRQDGWGETGSDDNVSDDDLGILCMKDGDNRYFRVYTMDKSINNAMDEDPTAATQPAETFTMATYNILHAESHPGPSKDVGGCNAHPVPGDPLCIKTRTDNQVKIITGQTGNPAFDVFGTEETSRPQYDELKSKLTGYDVFPTTNTGLSNSKDGAVAMWWNTAKFTKFDSGKAPNISNTAKDIMNPWVGLQTSSGQKFYVMTIHYPIAAYSDPALGDKGTLAKGSRLTLDWVKSKVTDSTPVFVVGDFNDRMGEKNTYCAYTKNALMQNVYDMAANKDPKNPCPTTNNNSIDHIYATPSSLVSASNWTHMSKSNPTVAHASDHTPVYASITIGDKTAAGGSDSASPAQCQSMSADDLGQIACKAYQFDNFGYLWGGGHGGTAQGFMNDFESGKYNAGRDSILDCSGLVRMSIFDATGVDIGGMGTGSYPGYSKFKEIPKSEAKAGDILYKSGHTEIIVSNNVGDQRYATFGAHTSNTAFPKQIGPSSYSYGDVLKVFRFQKG